MDFSELQRLDDYGAFKYYMTMTEAKRLKLIPEDVAMYFPDKCKCGSDMIISDNLKTMLCCNPVCYIKQGYALHEMIKRADVKGIGPAYCLDVMYNFSKSNPNKTYLNMIYEHVSSIASYGNYGLEVEDALLYVLSQMKTFPMLVGSLGIPKLGKKVVDVLKGINNSMEMLQYIVQNCNNSISIFLTSRGVIDDDMFKFYFKFYFNDIIYVSDMFVNLVNEADTNIKICITGSLAPNNVPVTRNEFIQLCNKVATASDGRRLYSIQDSSAIKSVNYLICDAPNYHTKYNIAVEREQIEHRKLIYTSTEFIDLLKKEVDEYERV